MSDLAQPLAERGFAAIDTDAPGGWASDGAVTVHVETEHGPHGLGPHEVTVFEGPPSCVDVGSVLAVVRDRSHNRALREALDEALDDRDGAGETEIGP